VLADKRALRRHVRQKKREYYLRKQRPKPLSAKERRTLGVHDLKKEECKYEVYKGLHRLWREYICEVLGIPDGKGRPTAKTKQITAASHGPLLASADFHGAELEVVKSACVGRVGTRGIVVRDTKFTFVLVCPGDIVRRVPKRGCVFRCEVPLSATTMQEGDEEEVEKGKEGSEGQEKKLVFELHGNQLEIRPAERANRKFKWKVTDFL